MEEMVNNRKYEKSDISAEREYEYSQSANSIFHFMPKYVFLEEIINTKVIIPRFCVEDISYLDLQLGGQPFSEIAVLQKCFCDIPFHQISKPSKIDEYDEQNGTNEKKYYCHTDIYGTYGIAFSKKWAEDHNIQPIHYINKNTTFSKNFIRSFELAYEEENLEEEISDSFIHRLAFMKPVWGTMKRENKLLYKNFHDEREWRFVPDDISSLDISNLVANPNICSNKKDLDEINENIKKEIYRELWLSYDYDDIEYLIVSDNLSRQELIGTIMSIPNNLFTNSEVDDVLRQKLTLISKIIVLEQIRKDF